MVHLKLNKLNSKCIFPFILILFLLLLNAQIFSKYNPRLELGKVSSPLAPFSIAKLNNLEYTNGRLAPDFELMPRGFRRTVQFDSTGANMVISENLYNDPFTISYEIPIKEYIRHEKLNRLTVFWNTQTQRYLSGELQPRERGRGGLEIQVPMKIKSKAFQQIFGGDRVSLSVTGNINIKGGFRHEKRDQVKTSITRGSDYNFKMEQTQQFQVQGHVGEKVTVSVDQNSERAFDFENTIKLKYTGFEDEIIQNIEAGNIALSLPATRFVTFSGKSSGLFGIKTEAKLGNLSFTSVMSQEKGENKKMSISGGATDDVKKIEDWQYIKNRHYFLSLEYRKKYWGNYKNGVHQYAPEDQILDIEVYKSGINYQASPQVVYAWALSDSIALAQRDTINFRREFEYEKGWFKRLDKSEYVVDPYTGKLTLRNTLQDEEILAVAYKTGSNINDPNVMEIGQLTYTKIPVLKLIKPKNPRPQHKTWDLMLRNIYSIGRDVPEDEFEVKIFYKSPSGTDQEIGTVRGSTDKKNYLEIFGLDLKANSGAGEPDGFIDRNPNLLRFKEGELEFPFHKPFDPDTGKFVMKYLNQPNITGENFVLLEDDKRCKIYDKVNQSEINKESKFYIEVKAKTRSANYMLGFNVIENSEEVYLNGGRLVSGKDYIIDYQTGSLTILRDDATSPSANIEISYQRNEFFQLEKKTLLGLHAKYDLWDNSFIGGTFLYLNQRTLDQKVRVGQGPMRNIIWDLNTKLSFQPNFLTKAVDALPFIRTKAESQVDFEAEIAQSIPNPNTLNNEGTGDNDGVAYIDDFEGSNRTTPLGVIRRSWVLASTPEESLFTEIGRSRASRLGALYWYNPYNQIAIQEIWPNRDVNANVPQTMPVLTIYFDPSKALEPDNRAQNWGGIMRALSAGYANQSESKYLEIWLKCPKLKGRVHVDLGQISEDVIPNYRKGSTDFNQEKNSYFPALNTEDRKYGIANGLLDDGEDIGLDEMPGADDWWDLNSDGIRQEDAEPVSNDDWAYQERTGNYERINGTENNEKDDVSVRTPDTEDINGNGDIDIENSYFEYTFDLDPQIDQNTKKYIQGGSNEQDKWRLYRIPLNDYVKKIGNPTFDLIEYFRIWFDGMEEPTRISFAEINIVGNQWIEKGLYTRDKLKDILNDSTDLRGFIYDESNDTTVAVSVMNTHENEDYIPPPGVSGVVDRITRVIAKEQALVLSVTSDLPRDAEGIAQKNLPQPLDFLTYNKMKMFVHGGDGSPSGAYYEVFDPDSMGLEFFIRFGSDDENYYEYRAPVKGGWDGNDMEIDLGQLASLKENIKDTYITSVFDSIKNVEKKVETREYVEWINEKSYQYILRVGGEPSLTNIRQITLGLKNRSRHTIRPDKEIQVWLNELRLSEVKKEQGIAMRARLDLRLADLLTLNAEIERRDADFHTIEQRFGQGQNEIRNTVGTNINFGKFFPTEWGLSLPVNVSFSESEGFPKYLAQSDILYKDVADPLRKEAEVNYMRNQGLSVSFKKGMRSKNFLIQHTLDNISLNYSTRRADGHNSSLKAQNNESHAGGVSYSINFGKRNYFEPFKWLGKSSFVKPLSQLKIYYLPSQISTSMNGTYSRDFRETRLKEDLAAEGKKSYKRQFNIKRQIQGGYNLFESLGFNYTRSWDSDLENAMNADSTLKITDIFNGKFGTKTGDAQSFSVRYNPNFVRWLTTTVNYSANFRWSNNIMQESLGRSANSSSSISGNVNFNPNQMVSSIFKITSSSAAPAARRRPTPAPTEDDKDKPKAKVKKEKTGPGFFVSSLNFITKKFQQITVSYGRNENSNLSGLQEGMPSWAYRLSPRSDPGISLEESAGDRNSSFSQSENYSIQSGLDISTNMKLTFAYKFNSDVQNAAQKTGGSSHNNFNGNPFPDWTFRWSGLEKIPLINKFATRVSLDHAYSGETRDKWTNSSSEINNVTTTSNWRPLVGMNMTLKKNITVNIRYNMSESIDDNKKYATGANKRVSSDLSLTANYSKRGGFRIPLPIWPFKNKELKNNIDLSLTLSSTSNESFMTREGKWIPKDSNEKWEFKPTMRYSFSDRVTGGMFFTVGKTKNKMIGDTSLQEFGIDVNISIRGN